MAQIRIKQISEHPITGMKRWEVKPEDASIILEWLEDRHGGNRWTDIRGYRSRKNGSFSFQTGGHYTAFDADLLGGKGDDKAERLFQDETGYVLHGY